MIYFVRPSKGVEFIKIGYTDSLPTRLSGLGIDFGSKAVLLAAMPGCRKVEKETHKRFSHLRLGRAERFASAPELLAFIKECNESGLTEKCLAEKRKSIRIHRDVYSQVKLLAHLTGRDIAEVASELVLKAIEKPLAAAWANRPKPDSPER